PCWGCPWQCAPVTSLVIDYRILPAFAPHRPIMRSSPLPIIVFAATTIVVLGCHSAPPPPPPVVRPLSDSANAALTWAQSHVARFSITDSIANANDAGQIVSLAGDARIVGLSELTEGTREFPVIVRRTLFALVNGAAFRGLAIQAPMPEA